MSMHACFVCVCVWICVAARVRVHVRVNVCERVYFISACIHRCA